jgi:protein-L-isoaspartate(D-aspartate) O-methyltransferase
MSRRGAAGPTSGPPPPDWLRSHALAIPERTGSSQIPQVPAEMSDSKQQRLNMVETQVRPSDITDRRIVRAMLELPREIFAPEGQRDMAYMDDDLPVVPALPGKEGRYLLAPRILAKLVQLAEVDAGASVLDVGCASGYSSAVLARLARSVVALECETELAGLAARRLRELDVSNVTVVEGPLAEGAAAHAPYGAIILNGAVQEVPQGLLAQLAEGGRLVAVVSSGRLGHARVWRRSGKLCDARSAFDAGAKPLPGFERQTGFVL